MREQKKLEKMAPTIEEDDNEEEKKIDKATEEKRAINIKKCSGAPGHVHDEVANDSDHYESQSEKKCPKFTEIVIMCLMDILLFLFLCTQEFNDASHLQSLIMQSQYTKITIVRAGIIAHMTINIATTAGAWLFCGLALTQGEGHFIACTIIYFIIGYETLFHVLP